MIVAEQQRSSIAAATSSTGLMRLFSIVIRSGRRRVRVEVLGLIPHIVTRLELLTMYDWDYINQSRAVWGV